MNDAAINRRAEYLLLEARADSPIYCHAMSTILRVLSNQVNFEHYSSRTAKKHPPRMSRGAYNLRQQLEADESLSARTRLKRFQAETINEHQEELRQVWNWIVCEAANLNASDITDRLRSYPPIVMTRRENATLKPNLSPRERYAHIEIVDASGRNLGLD